MEVCSRTSITTVSQAFLSTAAPLSRRASCSGVKPLGLLGANVSIIPIQVVLRHVALHSKRQLARHGFAGRKRPPQLGGRHVWRLDKAFDDALGLKTRGGELGRSGSFRARAAHDHHRRQRAHPLGLVPGAEQSPRVPYENEEEMIIRPSAMEL